MELNCSVTEHEIAAELQDSAARTYGQNRAAELSKRLVDTAHLLWLIAQQPLDLLDEEPDSNGR